MGGTRHGLLQMQLGFWFMSHQQDWHVWAIGELRTKVASNRVRLPDVAIVFDDQALDEELRTTPPLIAIEILSPDDRLSRVIRRLQDFLSMGTDHVWLLDPIERVAFTYTAQGLKLVEADRITLPDSPIYLDVPMIFSCLRKSAAI